jgi:heptosyltransferase-2
MKPLDAANKILIREANWVGDAIMTTPALRAIRQGVPNAHISLLVKPWVAPVFENCPYADRIITYDAQQRHKGLKGLIRLAADLRACKFDTAILFQNAFEAAFLSWLARIPKRIGFTTDGRSLLLTHGNDQWRVLKKGHLIDYYLGLVSGMGLGQDGRHPELFISMNEQTQAHAYLVECGLATDQLIIGLNPGAAYGTAKRWPKERYASLGKQLIDQLQAQILIFGAADESELGTELAQTIGKGSYNLCGKTSLRQAMALIDLCRLFVTNDSGLMHVAAAMNRPLIAIIGPTDPIATGPINRDSLMVHLKEACPKSPCLLPHCPIDHRCMTSISVDQIVRASLEIISARAS